MGPNLISRSITPLLLEALAESRAVGVLGPRQVGKTTLVRDLLGTASSPRYLTLDDPATREAARLDPTGFVADLEGPTTIDEIQRVPDLLLAIKVRLDRETRPGQFLITGSADILTLPSIRDALPGRVEYVRLWPFTQTELRGAGDNFVDRLFSRDLPQPVDPPVGRPGYADRVAAGGYPGAHRRTSRARRRFFDDYVSSMVSRDVTEIARLRDAEAVGSLLRLVAARSAGLLNRESLGRALGVDRKTVELHLRILENLLLVRELPAWHPNLSKREVKAPKVYVMDTGMMLALVGADQRKLVSDASFAGRAFETFVAMELQRLVAWSEDPPRLFHYRDRDGREVDVVMERADGSLVGVEVKSGATVTAADLRGLAHLRDTLGRRFVGGVVLYTGEATLPFGDRLYAAPIAGLWD